MRLVGIWMCPGFLISSTTFVSCPHRILDHAESIEYEGDGVSSKYTAMGKRNNSDYFIGARLCKGKRVVKRTVVKSAGGSEIIGLCAGWGGSQSENFAPDQMELRDKSPLSNTNPGYKILNSEFSLKLWTRQSYLKTLK